MLAVAAASTGLPVKFVIHTVGPIWRGGVEGESELLASCYRTTFRLVHTHGIRTIAFPAISCGVYGYPLLEAANIALRETKVALQVCGNIELVSFVCFSDDVFAAYQAALKTMNFQ